ncbi:Proteophosphoglycan 5 [Rhodotorula toruloides ATCC 204091]|uniref:Proteophosphoglycan 5 n=1 Tax=Rhodotorula toruloides TaxID=5286 RepID=A0A0K3CLS3_RHOTO|nr:Proteophosphoglycan 5 [Rhodotorula toruloides ATCC 204091]KAK4330250.1 Proteophosphoglycan 5 [Rhodotorula toruloides]PRQ71591.1 Proteophosphoglycan 5 [Rhodotorula toruloides]
MSTTPTDEGDPAMLPAPADSTTSLLDLPDELLTRIFDLAFEASVAVRPSRNTFGQHDNRLGTGYFTLNRRLYRLCRPRFLRRLALPSDYSVVEEGLAELLLHRNITGNVQKLAANFRRLDAHLIDVALVHFPKLERLALYFDTVSPMLAASLSTLNSLRHLALYRTHDPDSEVSSTLDLATSAPSVRCLFVHLEGTDVGNSLESTVSGLDRLESLELRLKSGGVSDESIPWSTLRTLRIRADKYSLIGGDPLLTSLRKACISDELADTRLPLRHFASNYTSLTSRAPNTGTPQHMLRLLSLLSKHASLEELEMPFLVETPPSLAPPGGLPSVRTLKLRAVMTSTKDAGRQDRFGPLFRLLGIFPNLQRLDVKSALPSSFWPRQAMTQSECALKCPEFFALLHVLHDTAIVEIRVDWAQDLYEVRWRREAGSAEWWSERYRLYGSSTW